MTESAGPERPDPTSPVSVEIATVRRSPRYLRFIVVAAVLGVIVAAVLTLVFPENPDYGRLQTFGFLALISAAVLGTLGALIALIFDARSRARKVSATHEIHEPDNVSAAPADGDPDQARRSTSSS